MYWVTSLIHPLVQAFGMIKLKMTCDPLQNISKLNLMMIVSINQAILPSFLPTMIKDDEWQTLNADKIAYIYQ